MPTETKNTNPAIGSEPARIRQIFDDDMKAWAGVQAQIDADMQCLSMEGPWPEAERKVRATPGAERPCLHEDVLTQFNNTTTNQLEMNPMGIDVQPEGDGADEESAEFVENRIREIEYRQNGQHAYLTAGKCAIECSMGFWELETDWASPFVWEKEFRIVPIMDPKSVLVDPNCKKPDWSDMGHAFKISRISRDEFKRKYPEAQATDFDSYAATAPAWFDQDSVQVCAFWEVTKKKRKLILIDDGTPEGESLFEDDLTSKGFKRIKGKKGDQSAPFGFIVVDTDEHSNLVEDPDGIEKPMQMGRARGQSYPILQESDREVPTVKKCLTNGIEILKTTEWEDEEIPILVVTGRVKFEAGKRVIDSQTRKGRTGQLLYDLCISSIQEETARIPKFLWLGAEGQFDTSTPWQTVHRIAAAFAEYKATVDDVGSEKPLPPPQLIRAEPQISALLELKQSLLLSISNAIGISTTERKDRSAKSGKALEQLQEDMNVATYHYHNSLRMAQLRQYRIINRMLPKIENTKREVGLRDVKGNYSVKKIEQNHYDNMGRHEVVISSAKYYQSLQEEQSEFATSLITGIKDPNIMLAVLPDLIRMKGLGPYGDDLAAMVETLQPPQMQAARKKDGQPQMPPEAVMAIQQAQQAAEALNAQCKEMERKIIELEDEARAKTGELASKERIAMDDNATKIEIASINQAAKVQMTELAQQVDQIKYIADVLTKKFSLDSSAEQAELDRQHEAGQSDADRRHASGEAQADRTHQAVQGDADRQQTAELTAQQLAAQQQAAETAQTGA